MRQAHWAVSRSEMLVLFKNSKSFQFEKTSNWAGHWSALSDFEEYTHCGNSSFVGAFSFLLLVTEQVAFIAAVLGSTALHVPKSIQPLGQGQLNFSPNLLSVQAQLQPGKREEWGEARCLQVKKEKRRKQTLSDVEVFKNRHWGGFRMASSSEKQVRRELSNRVCFQILCTGNCAKIMNP